MHDETYLIWAFDTALGKFQINRRLAATSPSEGMQYQFDTPQQPRFRINLSQESCVHDDDLSEDSTALRTSVGMC